MNMEVLQLLAAVIALFLVVVALFKLRIIGRHGKEMMDISSVNELIVVEQAKKVLPQRIVIGDRNAAPVISIERGLSRARFDCAHQLPADSQSMVRLSALLQAAPSLLVAAGANGKQLMEVSINGALVRAADGNGYRAMAMGPDGIKEHARLFEVENLENLIDGAAIWQIASVIVAQKHLADISQKLDEIKKEIHNVSSFLNDQRRATLTSTFRYLEQIAIAIGNGELSSSARTAVEFLELDLLAVHAHLVVEIQRKLHEIPKDSDTFGTESLCANIGKKIEDLSSLSDDISLCFTTRTAAWHVLSLYPGEPVTKRVRFDGIQNDLDALRNLSVEIDMAIKRDSSAIQSLWNKDETIAQRKSKLLDQVGRASAMVSNQLHINVSRLTKTEKTFVELDRPMQFIVEMEDGKLIAARELQHS